MRRHIAGYRVIPASPLALAATLGFLAGTIAAAVTR